MKKALPKINLSQFKSPTALIQNFWGKFNKVPGGNKVFSAIVGHFIPYTGSVSPIIQKIESGSASVLLKDKRAIRNHLDCIHAIALANVGEFTTGLCVISQLSEFAKAILVHIEVEYLKKARGDLISETNFKIPPNLSQDTEFKVVAHIKNGHQEVVTKVTATWRVRP